MERGGFYFVLDYLPRRVWKVVFQLQCGQAVADVVEFVAGEGV